MMQLQQTLSHLRDWSENYNSRKRSESFPANQEYERRLSELMDARSFDQLAPRIGSNYSFNNFFVDRYAYMYLDWDNVVSKRRRNESTRNPILEVKMLTDSTIRWKLINRTGVGGPWVGTQGRVNSFNELADQVQRVRANPAASMRTPATRLYNLGGFGNNLTG